MDFFLCHAVNYNYVLFDFFFSFVTYAEITMTIGTSLFYFSSVLGKNTSDLIVFFLFCFFLSCFFFGLFLFPL